VDQPVLRVFDVFVYLHGVRAAVVLALVLVAVPAVAQPFKGTKRPDVRYVPSPDNVVEAMLELARVTASDVVSDRVRFLTQDLFETDISQATVVTLFLLPRINQDLIPKLKRELRPGTRIVSHQFDMGEQWPPEKSQDVNGLMIYLWTIH
jgi:hypothetical protein